MTTPLAKLIASLRPVLHPGVYVFCSVPESLSLTRDDLLATFREAEGTTIVLEESVARDLGLETRFRAAWITLSVNSDLDGVGLTAAFTRALADAGIACNVIAAIHHDHLFVPVEQGAEALSVLEALSRQR